MQVLKDEISKKRRLLCFFQFNGTACKSELNFVEILEKLSLFCETFQSKCNYWQAMLTYKIDSAVIFTKELGRIVIVTRVSVVSILVLFLTSPLCHIIHFITLCKSVSCLHFFAAVIAVQSLFLFFFHTGTTISKKCETTKRAKWNISKLKHTAAVIKLHPRSSRIPSHSCIISRWFTVFTVAPLPFVGVHLLYFTGGEVACAWGGRWVSVCVCGLGCARVSYLDGSIWTINNKWSAHLLLLWKVTLGPQPAQAKPSKCFVILSVTQLLIP